MVLIRRANDEMCNIVQTIHSPIIILASCHCVKGKPIVFSSGNGHVNSIRFVELQYHLIETSLIISMQVPYHMDITRYCALL